MDLVDLRTTRQSRVGLCYKLLCNIFSKGTQPFGFIKCKVIWKLVYTIMSNAQVKLMEVWSCTFEILELDFFKLVGSIVENVSLLDCASYTPWRLSTLPIIDTHLSALRAYALLPSLISASHAFVLYCYKYSCVCRAPCEKV